MIDLTCPFALTLSRLTPHVNSGPSRRSRSEPEPWAVLLEGGDPQGEQPGAVGGRCPQGLGLKDQLRGLPHLGDATAEAA